MFRACMLAIPFALAAGTTALADDDAYGDIAAGHALVEENCAQCHAVGASGDSPNPNAPPFRTFKAKWPLEHLEEALAEGIVVGHGGAEMPEFVFEPDEISDILAYLDSLDDT